jgi:signal transduction histidine kinase
MAIWRSFALALPLVFAVPIMALDPNRALTQYQSKLWQAEDGLPRNNVRALALSKDGQLLVATMGGVAAFDATRFRPLAASKSSSYVERTQALLVTRDGAIWTGLQGSGVSIRRGTDLRLITTAEGLVGNVVQSLFEDESGAVWVGTQTASCRIHESGPQCLPGSQANPRMWSRFVDDNLGGVLVATSSGILRWERGRTSRLQQTGYAPQTIHTLYRARDRRLWAGGAHGLFRLELQPGKSRVTLKKVAGVPGLVVAMAEDRAGNLWVSCFGDGLYRVNARGVEHDTTVPDKFIVAMLVDEADNLWLGFRTDGLMRRTNGEFVPYGTPEGLRSQFALTVHEDVTGRLWLSAMDGGLLRFQNGRLTNDGLPKTLSSFSIYGIASGPRGDLWFGNWGDGLYHLQDGKLTRWDEKRGSPGRYIVSLLLDPHGDLWAGSNDVGLSVLRGASNSPGLFERLLGGESVNSLISVSPGVVLAGSNLGLSEIIGASIKRIASTGPVESLSQDSAKRVWVGLQNGDLGLFERGAVRLVPRNTGIPQTPVYAVLDDHSGSMWLATDRGIVRVLLDQLLDAVSGRRSSLDVALYGKEDGMRSSEVRGQGRPAAWRASNGDLWFATAGSFVQRPAQAISDREIPRPVIVETEVDGRDVDSETRFDLLPDARELTVRFSALHVSNPHQVKYRYKLVGYDRDWVADNGQAIARYGTLPLGQHTFVVQARSALGPWGGETATLDINRRPYWYQTWWFYLVSLLAASAVIWLAAKWYRSRVHGRVSAVLEERNRISREWHDSLMAGFAAISWQLEATHNLLPGSEQDVASSLDLARNMVRHTQAEARRIIWDLRLDLDESAPLSSSLEKLCERVSAVSHIDVKMKAEGSEVRLQAVAVHNLLRIAQEALQNAIKHAHPGSILVWLRYDTDSVTLSVKDDGCGFVNEESRYLDGGHLGILGMNERARNLGGSLEVRSVPGAGTEVVTCFALLGAREKQLS